MSAATTTPADRARNVEIANIIRGQIRRAMFMVGAKYPAAVKNGLKFRATCRGTKANYITITLDGRDTYTFLAEKVTGGRLNKKTMTHSPVKTRTVLELEGAYDDMLAGLIGDATGLTVSL
jgi:hypothetical protein